MHGNRGDNNKTLSLEEDAQGLVLVQGKMKVRCDFSKLLPRITSQRLKRELIVRAAHVKGIDEPYAVDATAGLGDDAFLLAAAGFTVTLIERDPTIAALLRDGLERASCDVALSTIAQRMSLLEGDSVQLLPMLEKAPSVVFLDPMFPEKQKSAQTKKKLQLIQLLERPCENEEALLEAALCTQAHKIVIKRPKKGPQLAGAKASYSISGKTIRYDVIVRS